LPVGHDEIGPSVSVQVDDRYRVWRGAYDEGRCRREISQTVAREDRDVVRTSIRYRKI
jgi:hypothetical protein